MNITRLSLGLGALFLATSAFALCGDGAMSTIELCDDGNQDDGDGCSALCQIEPGFECAQAMAAGDLNAVPDGGFEEPPATSPWRFTGPTPVCRTEACGQGGGSGAASGSGWAWFGGQAIAATQSAEQTVLVPPEATTLSFRVENAQCDAAADTLVIQLDGTTVWSVDGSDATCGNIGYREVSIDLGMAPGGPWNDGAAHTLRIEATIVASAGGASNFFVDDVLIDIGDVPGAPSVCTQVQEVCAIENFNRLSGNVTATGWSLFHTGTASTDWGLTDDGICASLNGPAGNHTGGDGEAACVDADVAGQDLVDAYLCTPQLDLHAIRGTGLTFRHNQRVHGLPGANDTFEVLLSTDTMPPDAASVGSLFAVFDRNRDNVGELGLAPGVSASIDLTAYDGEPSAYVCFRYGGRDDWYAQIDDVAIVADDCGTTDTDSDGVPDTLDNCQLTANANQLDTDGDGFGNACDADFNGDCVVNVVDLGQMRAEFFSAGPHTDLNGDGIVNAVDLGRLRLQFFGAPGPSALADCPAP